MNSWKSETIVASSMGRLLCQRVNAHHERTHSNASSAHLSSVNGHHPHQHHPGTSHGHSRPSLSVQSHSYPPIKQSSLASLQAPTPHLTGVASASTLSKLAGSHTASHVSLRRGASSSNSNLLTPGGQKSSQGEDEDGQVENPAATQRPRPPNSLPVSVVDAWEHESLDSPQGPALSSRPHLMRTPEFEDTASVETGSLNSASGLTPTSVEKKPSKKKKYLPHFLRKNSAKQKTS